MSYRAATSKSARERRKMSNGNLIPNSIFSFLYFSPPTFSLFLFSCVRNVLNKAKELGLQTIGICSLNIPERNYPAELAAHIALSKAHTHILCGKWREIGAQFEPNIIQFPTFSHSHSFQNQFESSSRRISAKLWFSVWISRTAACTRSWRHCIFPAISWKRRAPCGSCQRQTTLAYPVS